MKDNLMVAHGNITHPVGAKCKFCDKLEKEVSPTIELLNQALKEHRKDLIRRIEGKRWKSGIGNFNDKWGGTTIRKATEDEIRGHEQALSDVIEEIKKKK